MKDDKIEELILDRIIELKKRLDKLIFLFITTFCFAYLNLKNVIDEKLVEVKAIGIEITDIHFYSFTIGLILTVLFAMIGSHLIEYTIKRSQLDSKLSNGRDKFKDYNISKTIIPSSFYEFMYTLYCYQDNLRLLSVFTLFNCFFIGHVVAFFHYFFVFKDKTVSVILVLVIVVVHTLLYVEFVKSIKRANKLLGKIIKEKIFGYTVKFVLLSLILILIFKDTYFSEILEIIKVKELVTKFKIIILLSLVVLLFMFHVSCSSTILNTIKHFPPTHKDYEKFKSIKINKSSTPYEFQEKINRKIEEMSFNYFNKDTKLIDFLTKTKTEAFLIIKDNTIVYEYYEEGYNRKSHLMVWSLTKIFISTIVGVVVNEKLYENFEDTPITKFIPDLKGRINDSVSVKDLLSMTSGLNYPTTKFGKFISKINFLPYLEVHYGDNLFSYAIKKAKSTSAPGVNFRYSQLDSILLTIVLREALKKCNYNITSYLQEKIWNPLGMEENAFFAVDNSKDSIERGASGLFLSSIDVAKIGKLYLDKGVVNKKNILSKSWVDESINSNKDMSNFWRHTINNKINSIEYKDVYATGANGNELLYLVPEENIIIVRSGKGMFKNKLKDYIRGFCYSNISKL